MFRKNLAWFTLLVNLLTAGAAFAWVAVRPAETRALMGSERVADRWRELASNAGSLVPQGGGEAAEDEDVLEVADVKATMEGQDGAGKPVGPPPRKGAAGPPPRRADDAEAETGTPKTPPVETTPLGVWTRPLPAEVPPPELYPFRVDRRKYPDAANIQVELSVQNASGTFWKDATIVLKSPGHSKAVAFHVGTWRIDQIARLQYVFPKGELDKRITMLRVVSVEGERMESMLSEHISRKRTEIAQELGSKEDVRGAVGEADTSVEPVDPVAFKMAIPESLKPISADVDATGFPETEEGKRALQLYTDASVAAGEVDKAIRAFVDLVNAKGVTAIDSEEGRDLRRQALDAKVRFDQAGMDLALLLSRTKDESLKTRNALINQLSDTLFGLIDSIESQLAAAPQVAPETTPAAP